MRIALFCGEAAGARTLEALVAQGHEVCALLAAGPPVSNLAARLGLQPQAPARVRDPGFAAELARAGTELVLNVHSLYIVPPAVLQVPPLGAYNLHPGPLPGCAGLNAPSWAIYHGAARHGVTVHRMEAGIDTGAIVFEENFSVTEEDTGLTLALRCAHKGVGLIRKLLGVLAIDPDALPYVAQDRGKRRYFGREVPQGGRIDWNVPARRIYDFVRACDYHPFASPWGTPRARLGDREVEVSRTALTGERCDVAPGTARDDLVATADEWLRLKKVETI